MDLHRSTGKDFFSEVKVCESQLFTLALTVAVPVVAHVRREDASKLKAAIDMVCKEHEFALSSMRVNSISKLHTEVPHRFSKAHACFGYLLQKENDVSVWQMKKLPGQSVLNDRLSDPRAFKRLLNDSSYTVVYKAGDVIVPFGSILPTLYHVVSGRVLMQTQDGTPINEVLQNQIFGEDLFVAVACSGSKFIYVAGNALAPPLPRPNRHSIILHATTYSQVISQSPASKPLS